jgi:hypothetical protein
MKLHKAKNAAFCVNIVVLLTLLSASIMGFYDSGSFWFKLSGNGALGIGATRSQIGICRIVWHGGAYRQFGFHETYVHLPLGLAPKVNVGFFGIPLVCIASANNIYTYFLFTDQKADFAEISLSTLPLCIVAGAWPFIKCCSVLRKRTNRRGFMVVRPVD